MEENNIQIISQQIKHHKQIFRAAIKITTKIYSNSQLKKEKASILKYNKSKKKKKNNQKNNQFIKTKININYYRIILLFCTIILFLPLSLAHKSSKLKN